MCYSFSILRSDVKKGSFSSSSFSSFLFILFNLILTFLFLISLSMSSLIFIFNSTAYTFCDVANKDMYFLYTGKC